jgi:hypothetical protein
MALNPFFLQGSANEQRLIQELINEQLKIYGVEVTYIPRKFVRKETIIREVTTSKFDDNFAIEAYLANYEGYSGAGDILTKFGMSLKDELTLIISKERFEDFISPFLEAMNDDEIVLSSRPREGDIVYFPLGRRLFEIKFVEHEQPFYQLGKTYVYELKCELFEYEDELGGWNNENTTVEEIDSILVNQGYMTSLELFSLGQTATGTATTTSGYVRRVILNNDGYDYTSVPNVAISSAPSGGTNATAVASIIQKGGVFSIENILLINPGFGYTLAPTVTITGGNGVGAAATCEIVNNYSGISTVQIQNFGSGYPVAPNITFSTPSAGLAVTARGIVSISTTGSITQILISDAGIGYTMNPVVTINPPPIITGIGTFSSNEIVTGSISGATARVKTWNKDENILKVGTTDGDFVPGDIIVGSASSARYSVRNVSQGEFQDKYEQNDEIEQEADFIVDFSESNPFGNY